jgi:hypothetical protein
MGKCDDSSMRLTSTIELRRPGRKMIPCEYQSKPVAKVGTAEPSIFSGVHRRTTEKDMRVYASNSPLLSRLLIPAPFQLCLHFFPYSFH